MGRIALLLLLSVGSPPARQSFAQRFAPKSERDPMVAPEFKAPAVSTETLKDAPAPLSLPELLPPPPSKPKPAGPGIVPVASVWIMGGQSSLEREPATRTGSASVLTGFSVPLRGDWKLLPVYQGYYEAARQIFSSGFGTELIQQRTDQRFNVKLVHDLAGTPHRFKLNAGYRTERLRETKDEPWGRGLFDYVKPTFGGEYEYFYREPYSLRASYDYFRVRFPNYKPLEAQGALSVNGKTVARELVGGRVLDSRNQLLQLGVTGPIGRAQAIWDAWVALTLDDFDDQPVVDARGQLTPRRRRDSSRALNLSLRGARSFNVPQKVDAGLRTSATAMDSNQNSFDAFNGRFVPNHYSYRELRLSPHVTLHFRNPRKGAKAVRTAFAMEWAHRDYPDRPVQDRVGEYRDSEVWNETRTMSGTLVWPIKEHMSLLATVRRNRSISNMRYEAFYRYNYSNAVYMIGLGLEW